MNAYRTEARLRIEKLSGILYENPELQPLYQRAKKIVRVFRRPAFYEISQRCNLWCEGCYYFDEGRVHTHEMEELNEWRDFFSAEKARGVSMAYFVGAEPALEQERLLQSITCFPHGNIGTNGTVALHRDIPFRIGVSVWAGDDETDKALRGGSVFRKALKNYQGDRRAIMLYTVTRQNIDETRLVAEMCRDHDVELTFNMYSPTHSFEKKLMNFIENDKEFFRISSPGNTPCLDEEHLLKVRETLGGLIDDYPGTVLYSHAYNRWATTPGPLYDIDGNPPRK